MSHEEEITLEPGELPESPIDLPEIDQASVDALYEKDPMDLTTEDVLLLCQDLRTKRAKWDLKETARKTGKGPKRRTSEEVAAAKEAAAQLTADDLLEEIEI